MHHTKHVDVPLKASFVYPSQARKAVVMINQMMTNVSKVGGEFRSDVTFSSGLM